MGRARQTGGHSKWGAHGKHTQQGGTIPTFELIPHRDALLRSATGKRAQIMKEYVGYIEQLKDGRAEKLRATDGETVAAVRRRLGAAARMIGKDLVIKRSGDEVFFWDQSQAKPKRGRGRPRKSPDA